MEWGVYISEDQAAVSGLKLRMLWWLLGLWVKGECGMVHFMSQLEERCVLSGLFYSVIKDRGKGVFKRESVWFHAFG